LGFNGAVLKAHGSARERSIASAIRVASQSIQHQVNQSITREISAANQRLGLGEQLAPVLGVSQT
jgi:fatty acid/phospholipid biosynthesis enzyme